VDVSRARQSADAWAVETAHRLRQRISAVFRYAIASDIAETDPAAFVGAALQPVRKRKQPAFRDVETAQAFLMAYEAVPGHPTTKLASRLLALTAARPGMIQWAEPHEFEDLDGPNPIWRVPAEKMKLRKEHAESEAFEFILPLSRQAVETVKAARLFGVNRRYLFPSARHAHRPFTENALNVAYRRVAGFEGKHVPHGWRSTFSTVMNERAIEQERPADRAILDLMLAHVPKDKVEAAYNRASYMPRRRELAQEWADLRVGLVPVESLLAVPGGNLPGRPRMTTASIGDLVGWRIKALQEGTRSSVPRAGTATTNTIRARRSSARSAAGAWAMPCAGATS
jgi:integrase